MIACAGMAVHAVLMMLAVDVCVMVCPAVPVHHVRMLFVGFAVLRFFCYGSSNLLALHITLSVLLVVLFYDIL